jgi:DNA adenine methylase
MKKMPQPIPYQGSKRNIARQILKVLPQEVEMLIEPFAGSAAVSVAAAYYQKAQKFHLNDLNKPLMDLLEMIVNQPRQIADAYEKLWYEQLGRRREFYDFIRDEFNSTHRPDYMLYLLARCVKASVRYNADGEFNQSPDNRRKGRQPDSMRQEILGVSRLLRHKTTVTSLDYKDLLDTISDSALVYMDPPYQGTSQNKDPRYYSGLNFDELISFLHELNNRQISFILSYDGRTGNKTYGRALPDTLNLHKLEIYAGRSSQATLLGKKTVTHESLYLSPNLLEQFKQKWKIGWQNGNPYEQELPVNDFMLNESTD